MIHHDVILCGKLSNFTSNHAGILLISSTIKLYISAVKWYLVMSLHCIMISIIALMLLPIYSL